MSLIDDIESIAEQYRREMLLLQDELDECNRSTEERGLELAQQWGHENYEDQQPEEERVAREQCETVIPIDDEESTCCRPPWLA